MVSLMEILNFFDEERTLIERGEKAFNASDTQAFYFDSEKQEIYAEVHASMRNKTYKVKVYLDDGLIKQCTCECPKGRSKCHHMACVLIFASKNVSATDTSCKWKVQKEPGAQKTFEELFGSTIKGILLKKPTTQQNSVFMSLLKNAAPYCGLVWLMSPEPQNHFNFVEKTFSYIIGEQGFSDAPNKFSNFLEKMSVTDEEVLEIFKATKGQRDNPLWGMLRKGRITSSNFGAVIRSVNSNNIPPSLIKSLNGEYNLGGVKSIQWGICHEESAIQQFLEIKNILIQTGGLYPHSSGILGCLPDGIVGDDILEVKCPLSKANLDILKEIFSKKWYLVSVGESSITDAVIHTCGELKVYEFEAGQIALSLKDALGLKYYHQVQGILHIMGKKLCYFYVWTPMKSVIVPIPRDESWAVNIDKLIEFYKHVYIYNLLSWFSI